MKVQRATAPAASILWIGTLALVLLAQTLGWMHRGLHGLTDLPRGGEPTLATAASSHPEHAGHGSHHWVDSLFAGHQNASDCLLLDALTHAEGAPTPPVVLDLARPVVVVAVAGSGWVARQAVTAFARGPPVSH